MALQTQGFQVRPPPIPQIPANVGKVDVRAIYDSVMDGLKVGGALQVEPARQAAEQQKLMLAEEQAIADQKALPSLTRANIAANDRTALLASPEIINSEAAKTLAQFDADLVAEQNRRAKARALSGMTPEQQLIYEKLGPSQTSTFTTQRLPDGNISSTKNVLAQIGDQSIPVETVNTTGPYAAFAGIPNAVREFEIMTAGMTPEQKERARQFAVGIAARPSSAGIQYKEVVGADGVTRLVAVDPRAVGAQVIGSGERYGTGVDGTGTLPLSQPAASVAETASAPAPSSNVFASPTIGEAETQKAEAVSQARLQAERQEKLPKARAALRAYEAQTRTYLDNIDKAIKLTSWKTAGFGALAKGINSTESRALAGLLESISSRGGFSELAEMRQNSPTGGALGNVSDNENKRLDSANINLDQGVDPDVLKERLMSLKEIRKDSIARLQEAFDTDFTLAKEGGLPSASQPKPSTQSVDELLKKYQ